MAKATPIPNPLSMKTSLQFVVPRDGETRMAVYDLAGREVRRLADGNVAAGSHARTWDGRDDAGTRMAAGIYFLDIEGAAGGAAQSKLILIR